MNWLKKLFTKKEELKKEKPQTQTKRALHVFGMIGLALFSFIVLILTIRGIAGNPTPKDLNRLMWKDNGPMELSPERGRYALTYSIAENHSFSFTPDLARFATPDVGYKDGKYVSLFAPAVSFIAVPGYLLGKMVGLAQVGAFASIALFAIINLFLIRAIAIRLGANSVAATAGGMAFLFGSPAFAYAVTLYQHHISTFLILASIYLLVRFKNAWSLFLIWMLIALSIPVDYPNFFMMLPIGVYALGRMIFIDKEGQKREIHIPLLRILSIVGVVLPLVFFLWFNQASYGNPFILSGNVERSVDVKANGKPVLESVAEVARLKKLGQPIPQNIGSKSVLNYFLTRDLMNGFYIHFLSPDRGMIMYTPVMLFGLIGLVMAIRKRMKYVSLLTGVIGFNVLLYSMWTDPYGGWAFGSRYLIPSYAILAIFVSFFLTRYSKKLLVLLMFFIVMSYSISVNTLGAITSNRNPPQIEATGLSLITHKEEPYTYQRNINLLSRNISKSYFYGTYVANNLPAWNYYAFVTTFIILTSGFVLVTLRSVSSEEESYEV